MRKLLLTLAAIYLGLIGLALMLVPQQFGIGAVPPDASPQLLALLRLLGGPMLGIAVLNWLARGDVSPAVIPVLAGNLVGFGLVAANWQQREANTGGEQAAAAVVHSYSIACCIRNPPHRSARRLIIRPDLPTAAATAGR